MMVDEDDYLFEAPLCEGRTLKILHRPDLVCQLLTLETNSFDPGNK